MKGYAVDVVWDDPCDHREERRANPRFGLKYRITIKAHDEGRRSFRVGPGIVRNISQSGVLLYTKHRLTPGRRVHIVVGTMGYPAGVCMPDSFEGTAEVLRVEPVDDRRSNVALRFGEEFSQNMEFAVFIDRLQAMARAASSTKSA